MYCFPFRSGGTPSLGRGWPQKVLVCIVMWEFRRRFAGTNYCWRNMVGLPSLVSLHLGWDRWIYYYYYYISCMWNFSFRVCPAFFLALVRHFDSFLRFLVNLNVFVIVSEHFSLFDRVCVGFCLIIIPSFRQLWLFLLVWSPSARIRILFLRFGRRGACVCGVFPLFPFEGLANEALAYFSPRIIWSFSLKHCSELLPSLLRR